MKKIKSQIPNFVTSLNLVSGSISIILASKQLYGYAFLAVLIGAGFDFFDGILARLLKTSSEIGKQLDSFSDLVSFGLAPSLVCFFYFETHIGIYSYFFIAIPVAVAYRLARFNIEEGEKGYFKGMPSPIVGITIVSLPYTLQSLTFELSNMIVIPVLLILISTCSLIMLSNIRYVKINISNKIQAVILFLSLVLLFLYSTKIFLPIFIFYLLSPIFYKNQ